MSDLRWCVELQCQVCHIRWCSIDRLSSRRKTCSDVCRFTLVARHRRRREECECSVCAIRWCSLSHTMANRETCSEPCRRALSALKQMNPMARYSGHKHRRPFAPPTLKQVAEAHGVPFFTARGKLGGMARIRQLGEEGLQRISRKGGKASMRKLTREQRQERGRRNAAVTNHKRWGTPLPDGFKR